MNHFRLYRTNLIKEFTPLKYDGAQDYDLTLKFIEKYKVGHIREILYKWRKSETSTTDNIYNISPKIVKNNLRSLKTHLNRKNIKAKITQGDMPTHWHVKRNIKTKKPVSIIILTKNKLSFLNNCIDSIEKHTNYPYEIIIIDTGSTEKDAIEYLRKTKHKVIFDKFHFSKNNNRGVKEAKNNFVVLLNNDTIATKDWLTEIIRELQRPEVGIVGCFNAKTLIETDKGKKIIKNINIGDKVYTHKNRLKKVTRTFKRPYDGKWIKMNLDVRFSNADISMTEEHPVLIYRNNKLQWIKAKNILKTDKVFVKSKKCKICDNPTEFWKQLCSECNPAELLNTRIKLQKKAKLRKKSKNVTNYEGSLVAKGYDKMIPFMEEYKKNGYRVIPVDHIPHKVDFITIKNNKVNGVEVVSGRYMLRKKENHFQKQFLDNIIWRGTCLRKNIESPLDGFIPVKIRKIKHYKTKKTTVYNFEVDDDNSYLVSRFKVPVHNCKLLFPNGKIQHAGVGMGIGGLAGHTYLGQPENYWPACYTKEVSAVTGAAMATKKDIYEKVGGLDENYMIEFQDIDYAMKVKELGYKVIYTSQSLLYHHCSVSRGNPTRREAMNDRSLFASKWEKHIRNIDPFLPINLTDKNNNQQLDYWLQVDKIMRKK